MLFTQAGSFKSFKFFNFRAVFINHPNLTIMYKVILAMLFILILACNTKSKSTPEAKGAATDTAARYTWSDEDQKEFLADCVDGATKRLGDTAAYRQCNCVLRQLKEKFPSLDSADNSLKDTAQVAAYIANCK